MKKTILTLLSLTLLFSIGVFVKNKIQSPKENITELRQQHENFLHNSPFKESLKLTKAERKAQGLTPNKYFERQWELTMDPATGKPHPEKLLELQEILESRVPGENVNEWVERGPNNVGGRTRAVLFDPSDASGKRVFAGGVSGGLWVNEDITDANSSWLELDIPQNLAVSSIAADPNDTKVLYVGTGESYVGGDVNGNGLWKSTDGGNSWAKVFGGVTGETEFKYNAKVVVNSPGSIAGEYLATEATFGGVLSTMTGDLTLVAPIDACSAITNAAAINGNIAVIQRGSCNFDDKVLAAQNAGAVAVIMVNNVSGPPISMGGDDVNVTIPSLMISNDDGQTIIDELGSGVNVTIEPTNIDGIAGSFLTPGIQHINDVKTRNVGGSTEIYVAAGASAYTDANPTGFLGLEQYGLYKSVDNGASWSEVSLPLTSTGEKHQPNDIEIGADNTVWVATTTNLIDGSGGGVVFSSADGNNFSEKTTVANGVRTQIAVSSTDPDVAYLLVQLSAGANAVAIIKTEDSFATETDIALPEDADTGIPASDFTRGQAFYDLMIEVDPSNDTRIYVGGIDLFRGDNSGIFWSQISKWSNNNNLAALDVPLVHADQHAFVFDPSDSNKALIGNDGGVYYANSLSTAHNSETAIEARNKDYNVTQFYHGAIGAEVATEKLIAGAQDNGTQLINSAISGVNSSTEPTGGDGAYVFIDKDNEYMISSYVYNSYYYINYAGGYSAYTISSNQSTGDFINPAALDSEENVLFANGSAGTSYSIVRYEIGESSATSTTFTNAMLDGSPTAFKVSPFSNGSPFAATTLFVGTDNGKLFRVDNANTAFAEWNEITGNDFYGSISSVQLGETVDDIYVTFYNYGITNIYYSTDGGSSWTAKEGNLPDLPVRAIMANPLNYNEVIIGTDLGVWATPDFTAASPTWYRSQNGMKDVKVTSFDLRTADNTVIASTYGRGMFTGQFTSEESNLSVDKFEQNNLVKVYPTISNGEITISPLKDVEKGNIHVFDINGRNVFNKNVDFNGAEQNLSLGLSSGMYIVKFSADNLHSTHKIIIE
ncbi:PA domain-containing protein [Urechidicola croceus]|uniref:PA domain-containing protein n=1 Tax=Urechidicola croceus TaxID=1850246 RepID=A0A1D8P901_9FLAO|nr:PA domain-containing protein [Urechidicola croceus]AOW21009.1 hypothetical protein LPB138_10105 [Urechidicola croceus]